MPRKKAGCKCTHYKSYHKGKFGHCREWGCSCTRYRSRVPVNEASSKASSNFNLTNDQMALVEQLYKLVKDKRNHLESLSTAEYDKKELQARMKSADRTLSSAQKKVDAVNDQVDKLRKRIVEVFSKESSGAAKASRDKKLQQTAHLDEISSRAEAM